MKQVLPLLTEAVLRDCVLCFKGGCFDFEPFGEVDDQHKNDASSKIWQERPRDVWPKPNTATGEPAPYPTPHAAHRAPQARNKQGNDCHIDIRRQDEQSAVKGSREHHQPCEAAYDEVSAIYGHKNAKRRANNVQDDPCNVETRSP